MGRRKLTTNLLRKIHDAYPDISQVEMAEAMNIERQEYNRWARYPHGRSSRLPAWIVPLVRKTLCEKVRISFEDFYKMFEDTYPPYNIRRDI